MVRLNSCLRHNYLITSDEYSAPISHAISTDTCTRLTKSDVHAGEHLLQLSDYEFRSLLRRKVVFPG